MPGTATVCGACRADLARALEDVPALAAHLNVTLARQHTRTGGGASPRGEVHDDRTPAVLHIGPAPYDHRASDAAWNLRLTLAAWVRALVQAVPARPAGPVCSCTHRSCTTARWAAAVPGGGTPAAMARWLAAGLPTLTRHPEAAAAVDEITDAVRLAERAVDRPAGQQYAGPCGAQLDHGRRCERHLYARPGAATVECPACRRVWGLDARRERMLNAVLDQLATAAQAAHILTQLAAPLKSGTVRQWAARGRLVAHGHDAQGHPTYRVADVLDLLVDKLAREEAARAKRDVGQAAAHSEKLAS